MVRPRLLDLLHFPEWFTQPASRRCRRDGIFDEFDRKVDRLLTERGRAPDAEPKDLLARLLAARDAETGGGMTAKEVRDQVVTIFMAGPRDHLAGAVLDLVSAVAASGDRSQAP